LATKTSPADVANLIAEAASNYATSAQGAKADSAVQPTALDSYLPKSGGTMTGAIAMGAQKITNLGAPTATTDAATKAYVDGVAAAGGSVPWATLRAMGNNALYDSHWGFAWEGRVGGHMIRGVGVCSASSDAPSTSTNGPNCWCRVSSVNGIEALGAWVYNYTSSDYNGCLHFCAADCGYCARAGVIEKCRRAALFAAP
jgi:hypothetical protein